MILPVEHEGNVSESLGNEGYQRVRFLAVFAVFFSEEIDQAIFLVCFKWVE